MPDSRRDSMSNNHTYYFILSDNYIKESKTKKEKQTRKDWDKAKKELKPKILSIENVTETEENLIILNHNRL